MNAENAPNATQDAHWQRLALLIALSALVARLWMMRLTHATTEDFLITLRYAENIAHGNGFVYNLGERVLGTTTPLYTLFLALLEFLHLNATLGGKLLNILADSGTCYLLARLMARKEIGTPLAGLFAALLYAFGSTPIAISIGGMETGVVACVGMGMVSAFLARKTRTLYVLGAILLLLRIDGLLLFGLLTAGEAWRERRFAWREMALSLALIAPWLLFATLYFGSPIPTSLIAKLTVYSSAGMAPSRSVIYDAFRVQFLGGWLQKGLTLCALLGIVGLLFTAKSAEGEARRDRVAWLFPVAWLALYYGMMLRSTVPPFPWYFLPPWALYLGFAMGGANWVTGHLPQGAARQRLAYVGLILLGAYGVAHLKSIRTDIAASQALEDEVRLPIGLWLREKAQPQERVMLEPIGYIGYYSRMGVLDLIGLVSPEVLPSYQRDDFLADIVSRLKPEWLCLRPHEAQRMEGQGLSLSGKAYEFVRDFRRSSGQVEFLIYRRRE